MTSANVTYYEVYKDGKYIDSVSQHCYCKCTYKEELSELFKPAKDYTLIVRWPDEEENDQYSKEMNLEDFMNGKKVEWEENPWDDCISEDEHKLYEDDETDYKYEDRK